MTGDDGDLKDLGQQHRYFFNPKAGTFLTLNSNQDAYLSFSVANREPTRSDFKAAGDINATPRQERLFDTELGYKLRGEVSLFPLTVTICCTAISSFQQAN